MADKALGEVAYEAWCAEFFSMKPVTEEFPVAIASYEEIARQFPDVAASWQAAAEAVREELYMRLRGNPIV